MKAVQITRPGTIELVDRPAPASSPPGQVVIEVERIGYCGSDLATFRGLNPLVSYPRVPGHEIQGRIAAVGGGVPIGAAGAVVGESVTVLPYTSCGRCAACLKGRFNACKNNQTLGVQREGALTERIVVPWEKVVRAPGLSDEELALVEPLAVGFHAVARGRVTGDDTIAVFGCGMIGLGVIAAAALERGGRVIAVDIDDGKLDLARAAGAADAINARTQPVHDRLQELTGGHGPDVCVEAAGTPQTFVACVEEVGFAGRVVYVGYAKQSVSYETKWFVLKELDVLGSRGAAREDFERVIMMLAAGKYPVARTLTRTVPLGDAPAAMVDWAADPAKVTKIHVLL